MELAEEGERCDQWQEQPPPQHPPPADMADGAKLLAVFRPKTESLRMTWGLSHSGHATVVAALATYF